MQSSFSDLEYASKKKLTRRDRFLAKIDEITPWSALVAELEAFYPKGEGRGRPPIGLERMLRMYVAQQCFGLSDEGIEDAVYDSQSIRGFVGIDLAREPAPDATSVLKFRRLLERHGLTHRLFEAIKEHLSEQGLFLREGTIVDATLIGAAPSTKNRQKARDPDMHQAKKGKNWHFGMKAHIGVDMDSGIVHSMIGTAANVGDVTQAGGLLHGDEKALLGDAGYQGVEKREEHEGVDIEWHIAMRPGKRRELDDSPVGQLKELYEQRKASLRAKVEHPFHVVKNLFRHRKLRYKGLAKNTAQLFTLFGLANLVIAGWRLASLDREVAS
jgi:transposase, IS5 family